MLSPLAVSRRSANDIKRAEPITVVSAILRIGKEREAGAAGSREGTPIMPAPLRAWMPPVEWGVSAHVKHLRNLYVYFWRWATWKVFGGSIVAPNTPPATPQQGVVCFITVAGFLNGPGFEKMRSDLRRELRRDMGDRLLAGRPSAVGSISCVSGRTAAGMHRLGGTACGLRPRCAGARAVPISTYGYARRQVRGDFGRHARQRRLGRLPEQTGALLSCRKRPASGTLSRRWRISLSIMAPALCRGGPGSLRG